MNGSKERTKTGFEVDVVCARRIYIYTGRAGVCKKAKRQGYDFWIVPGKQGVTE